MAEPLNYWNPKDSPHPPAEEKLKPTAAVPIEFDALLSQTNDHAAVQAILSALKKMKIEVFRANDGKRVAGETSLHVRAADLPKASVVAAAIFARRKKISAYPRTEQPTEGSIPDINFDTSF